MRRANPLCACWLSTRLTWRRVLSDTGLLLMSVLAAVVYAFFYPYPYTLETVSGVPVAVVDQDRSALSRQLVRMLQASPRLRVNLVTHQEPEARQALLSGSVQGLVLIPPDMQRKVMHGNAVTVPVEGNGASLLLNKTVLQGATEAIGTLSAGIELARRQAAGASPEQAQAQRAPVSLQAQVLFNPREGYASYIFPAVAVLIVQQVLVISAAMLVGTALSRGTAHARWHHRPARAVGMVLALTALGVLSGLMFFGLAFSFWGLPAGGNLLAAFALLWPFCLPCVGLGLALGAWAASRERVLMLWMTTSIPLMFASGISWPREAMPAPLQWLSMLSPSTAGVPAFVRLNQQAAEWADVGTELRQLLALGLVYGLLAAWALRRRSRGAERPFR